MSEKERDDEQSSCREPYAWEVSPRLCLHGNGPDCDACQQEFGRWVEWNARLASLAAVIVMGQEEAGASLRKKRRPLPTDSGCRELNW